MRIAAVVATYNRKGLLVECIGAVLGQTRPPDAVFLVDNASTDGTFDCLKENGFVGEGPDSTWVSPDGKSIRIRYDRMTENTGGAGAFHEGVRRAYEAGFDWLWLMDDDARPEACALQRLEEYLEREKPGDVAVLASKVVDRKGDIMYLHRGWFDRNLLKSTPLSHDSYNTPGAVEIGYASFVGFLLNSRAIAKAGLPNKDYFIRYDDVEYSLRLSKAGRLLLINDSLIVHEEQPESSREQSSREQSNREQSNREQGLLDFWKMYYGLRNMAFMSRERYRAGRAEIFFKIFLRHLVRIFLFYPFKREKCAIVLRAYRDFLWKRSGKMLDPGAYTEKIRRRYLRS